MKKKTIVSSILTIVLCLSLIAGSTYALFTSKDEVNIAVSSGKVEVKAVLKNLHYASELGDGTTLEGSSAVITEEDRLLTLTNIVPGDYVTFDIVITNNSTVAINYRTVIQMLNDTGLWAGLKVTIGANEAGEAVVYDGTHSYANWAQLLPESEDIVVPVKISLPVEAEDKYQDKSCKISYRVEAVQGNAPVVDPYTYKDGVYYINSEEGMMLMNQILATVPHNEGIAINFALTADMDMTGYTWAPIRAHWVNIDGQGHKVSNLNCTTNEVAKSGFVGYLGAGTIKNITLENVTVAGEQAGVLVGQVEAGTIENVTIAGTNTVSYYDDPAYDEQWSGVGAVIGVDVSGNTDKTGVTIAEGATIAVAYNGFKTQLAGPANEFAFNLAINVTNNGTVTTEGNAICMENGIGYLYIGNDKMLYTISDDFTSETLNIPEGVTALRNKLLNGNTTIKEVIIPESLTNFGGSPNGTQAATGGFFYKSAVEKIVLPEGMTEIPVGAFNQAANLKEINIPSTVTTIGIGAFGGTGLTELTIPASVTTIGGGAFRDMANLTTVIIEGDVTIPSYAFRSCKKLENVYIKGEDVTFEKGMIFTCYDTGDGSGINIYVANETVKERLLAADTAATTYGGYSIIVASFAFSSDEIEKAFANSNTVVLGSGNYVIPDSAQGKTLTIIGNGVDTVVATQDDGSYEGCDYSLDGSIVTFEGITINTDSHTYTGYARLKATYNNCTINGTYTLYDNSEFNNCTFNVSGDVYNIWTWGAPTVTFNNCTFNSDGKALLLYGTANTNLTVNGCTFNDKGGLTDLKAAIEIGNDYGKSYTLTVNNTTVNGYEINDKGIVTGTTLWANKNSMKSDKLTVIIDGVTQIIGSNAEEKNEALADALKNGANVTLTEDVETEATTTAPYGNKVAFVHNGGVFDGNGNKLDVECYGDDYAIMTSGGTIKNLIIEEGCRAIVIMSPTQDIILDNLYVAGDILYPINTAEHATVAGVDLIVTNSWFGGWSSFAGVESASFTNCYFIYGDYGYGWPYDCLVKPYINTTFTECDFANGYYIDLSALEEGCKVTFKDCTLGGVELTAENFAQYLAEESNYVEGEAKLIVELRNGTYLTAENLVDYIIFE